MIFIYILSETKIYKIIKPVMEPVIEPFKSDFLRILDVKRQHRISDIGIYMYTD